MQQSSLHEFLSRPEVEQRFPHFLVTMVAHVADRDFLRSGRKEQAALISEACRESWTDERYTSIREAVVGSELWQRVLGNCRATVADVVALLDAMISPACEGGATPLAFCRWLLDNERRVPYATLLGSYVARRQSANELPLAAVLQGLIDVQTVGMSGLALNDYLCTLLTLERLLADSEQAFVRWAVVALGGYCSGWDPTRIMAIGPTPSTRGRAARAAAERAGPDASRCRIAAIARIGYDQRGIDRRIRVAHHLNRAVESEGVLYLSKPQYRDHLDHVVAVWITGELLSGAVRCEGGEAQGIEQTALVFPGYARPHRLLEQWYLAALYHDMGYVVDALPQLRRQLSLVECRHIERLAEQLDQSCRDVLRDLNGSVREAEGLRSHPGEYGDHGIVSYSHLRHILAELDRMDAQLGVDSSRREWLVERYAPALRAILLHNRLVEPVDAQADPLAALLIICDELQEWGRYRLPVGEAAQRLYELVNLRAIARRPAWSHVEDLTIENGRLQDGRLVVTDQEPLHCVLAYKDQNENVYNPLDVLLMKLANFQRLKNGAYLKLVVDLRIPRLSGKADGRKSRSLGEIEILAALVQQEDAGWIDPSITTPVKPAASAGRAIAYLRGFPDSQCDTLRIDLARLACQDRPLLTRMPWEFQEELLRFKREYCLRENIPCTFLAEDDRTYRYLHG